jgi:hypothetical protein
VIHNCPPHFSQSLDEDGGCGEDQLSILNIGKIFLKE